MNIEFIKKGIRRNLVSIFYSDGYDPNRQILWMEVHDDPINQQREKPESICAESWMRRALP